MKNTLREELAHHDAQVSVGMDVVYYGRCAKGCTGINDAKWNIIRNQKITHDGNEFWVKTYSNGNEVQNLKMINFADPAIKYSHLKA